MTTENNNKLSKKFVAAALGALTLGAGIMLSPAFKTSSHVPDAKTNKQQHDLLAPYAGFIMDMKKAGGGHCCGMQDGIGKVIERHTDDLEVTEQDGSMHADTSGTHYHVKLTKDREGRELPNGGVWLDIPDYDILDVPQVEAVKAEHADDPTFKAPPFNILWTASNFPTQENPGEKPYVYCFWPTPHIQ